ncbi:hypothetical protein [Telluribacter humicola]|uniref:hypothetical protein n=1 Tax=Telluribacter humicola TaxID=1720261 RepID=UPI001A96C7B7|nr:hypothetical protein [Telluribacter humicola]
MKKRMNWVRYFLLLCGAANPVTGWTQAPVVKAELTNTKVFPASSVGLLPATFRASSVGEDSLRTEKEISPLLSSDKDLVPPQFRAETVISVREQQRIQEEQSSEALYRAQSDPAYFEQQRKRFREEYQRRVKVRNNQ